MFIKKIASAVALSLLIAPLALAQNYDIRAGIVNGQLVTDTIAAMVVAESVTCEAKGYITPGACSAFKLHRDRIITDANAAIARLTDPVIAREITQHAQRHRDVERARSLLLAFGE